MEEVKKCLANIWQSVRGGLVRAWQDGSGKFLQDKVFAGLTILAVIVSVICIISQCGK
ncbi:MAG: hypothetical protein MJ025_02860 [Victivallaceae bacterium]|nr:hypothetical protein [Victivallaceae bacterium]